MRWSRTSSNAASNRSATSAVRSSASRSSTAGSVLVELDRHQRQRWRPGHRRLLDHEQEHALAQPAPRREPGQRRLPPHPQQVEPPLGRVRVHQRAALLRGRHRKHVALDVEHDPEHQHRRLADRQRQVGPDQHRDRKRRKRDDVARQRVLEQHPPEQRPQEDPLGPDPGAAPEKPPRDRSGREDSAGSTRSMASRRGSFTPAGAVAAQRNLGRSRGFVEPTGGPRRIRCVVGRKRAHWYDDRRDARPQEEAVGGGAVAAARALIRSGADRARRAAAVGAGADGAARGRAPGDPRGDAVAGADRADRDPARRSGRGWPSRRSAGWSTRSARR